MTKPTALEPRVAILETSVERLTDSVDKLVTHGEQVEQGIKDLTILVTKAQAPKSTNWGLVVQFLFLMIAVGSAVFWPMNMRMDFIELRQADIKEKLQREMGLITDRMERELQNLGDRLILRMNTADTDRNADRQKDLDELRNWRLRALQEKSKP